MAKWLDRVRVWVRALWHEVLDEEPTSEFQHGDLAEVNVLLEALSARGAAVRAEYVAAATREKQAQLEWQTALKEISALDSQIDEALRAGQEPLAQVYQDKLNRLQLRVTALAERQQANQQIVAQLHAAAVVLQTHEAEARQRLVRLAEQHQHAQVVEQLLTLRRTLRRDTETLQTALNRYADQVARLEDQLAGRAELDRPH